MLLVCFCCMMMLLFACLFLSVCVLQIFCFCFVVIDCHNVITHVDGSCMPTSVCLFFCTISQRDDAARITKHDM